MSATYLSRCERLIPTSFYKLFACSSLVKRSRFGRPFLFDSSGWFSSSSSSSPSPPPSSSSWCFSSAQHVGSGLLLLIAASSPVSLCVSPQIRPEVHKRSRIATYFSAKQGHKSRGNAGTINICYGVIKQLLSVSVEPLMMCNLWYVLVSRESSNLIQHVSISMYFLVVWFIICKI